MRKLLERIRGFFARRRAAGQLRRSVRAQQRAGAAVPSGYTVPTGWQSYMDSFDEAVMTHLRSTSPDALNDDFFDSDIEVHFRQTEASGEQQRARHVDMIERDRRDRNAALIACRRKMAATANMLAAIDARLDRLNAVLESENSFDTLDTAAREAPVVQNVKGDGIGE